MNTLRTKLLRSEEVAERTMAFHFQKPAGFAFRAGQSIDLTLVDPPEIDAAGSTRTFTIASAPWEEELMVATRLRDTAFKRVVRGLKPGADVLIEGPMGSFTLHSNSSKPAVFLAGGIGITPFLSISRHAARERLPHRLYLFYSNHRPEDSPFLDSLVSLEKANPNFRLIATMTDMQHSARPWNGETGGLNATLLRNYLEDLHGPIYYLAGPPEMVEVMRDMLIGAGADEDDLRAEEFAGY
jgi:ferredoxin-NADP reductase